MQTPRIYCPAADNLPETRLLNAGMAFDLHESAAKHIQVLRLQPGDAVTLFDGLGGEFDATVQNMGRKSVTVIAHQHRPVEREAGVQVHLALGVPANDRMDDLVEKATELGVASITPLLTERSVLRLSGERADKRRAHWQAIAVAACEQSGRNRVPIVHPMTTLAAWLSALPALPVAPIPSAVSDPYPRWVLSFSPKAASLLQLLTTPLTGAAVCLLSGPEGGLSANEEARAGDCGFAPLSLGARTLRADTAPLAALAAITGLS